MAVVEIHSLLISSCISLWGIDSFQGEFIGVKKAQNKGTPISWKRIGKKGEDGGSNTF